MHRRSRTCQGHKPGSDVPWLIPLKALLAVCGRGDRAYSPQQAVDVTAVASVARRRCLKAKYRGSPLLAGHRLPSRSGRVGKFGWRRCAAPALSPDPDVGGWSGDGAFGAAVKQPLQRPSPVANAVGLEPGSQPLLAVRSHGAQVTLSPGRFERWGRCQGRAVRAVGKAGSRATSRSVRPFHRGAPYARSAGCPQDTSLPRASLTSVAVDSSSRAASMPALRSKEYVRHRGAARELEVLADVVGLRLRAPASYGCRSSGTMAVQAVCREPAADEAMPNGHPTTTGLSRNPPSLSGGARPFASVRRGHLRSRGRSSDQRRAAPR